MALCACGRQASDGTVETFGSTSVHKLPPWHRVVDAATIRMKQGRPEVDADGDPIVSFEALEPLDYAPRDRE